MQLDMAEQREQWMLSPAERALVATKSVANRFAFAVLLLFYRNAGRFPNRSEEITAQLRSHLSEQVDAQPTMRSDGELTRTIKR